MPQVDLETLVSACAGVSCDNKIVCETLADAGEPAAATDGNHGNEETDPPNFPPESFCLSKDAEVDWFDRNAFLERKDSTKGSSHSTNLNPNVIPSSSSHRFPNLKSKASIIGLPKPQKSCLVDPKRHCKPGNTRLFPKRSGSVSKSDSSVIEPSSPKVSCMGRVRSKKDRTKNRQCLSEKGSTEREKPERKQTNIFLASFRAIFRAKKKANNVSVKGSVSRKSSKTTTVKTSDIRDRLPVKEKDGIEPAAGSDGVEPVGLGGMQRFASGRRSESWID